MSTEDAVLITVTREEYFALRRGVQSLAAASRRGLGYVEAAKDATSDKILSARIGLVATNIRADITEGEQALGEEGRPHESSLMGAVARAGEVDGG